MDDRDWRCWSEERGAEMWEVFRRLSEFGIIPDSGGYDVATLITLVEDRRTDTAAFVVADECGGFYAWIDEWQSLAVDAHGWTPVIALARAIDVFIADEPLRREHFKNR